MSLLVHLADRVLNRPLLLTPEKAEVIMGVLGGRIGLDLDKPTPEASRFLGQHQTGEDGRTKTYRQQDGVAMIGVMGSLVNRGAWVGASSGLTSYEGLAKQITDAAKDPTVNAIMLDINSPGGEAGGMFQVAKAVRAAAREKRVVAVVNDMAASAAYGIASGASEIVVSESSIVGSIGVVMMHVDRSGQLAEAGIKPTLIHAGAHKVDGNSFGPLTDSVRAQMQVEVDKIYNLFLEAVAAGRGSRLDKNAARRTEAKVFMGQDAVARGLADRVGSFEDVLASLSGAHGASGRMANGGLRMDTNEQTAEATETAPASNASAPVPAPAAAAPNAAATERARIQAITTGAESVGRSTLASFLAFETDLSADLSVKILSKAPKGADAASAPSSTAASYVEQKQAEGAVAGSLNLATPAAPPAAEVTSGWKAAVERANQRFAQ